MGVTAKPAVPSVGRYELHTHDRVCFPDMREITFKHTFQDLEFVMKLHRYITFLRKASDRFTCLNFARFSRFESVSKL